MSCPSIYAENLLLNIRMSCVWESRPWATMRHQRHSAYVVSVVHVLRCLIVADAGIIRIILFGWLSKFDYHHCHYRHSWLLSCSQRSIELGLISFKLNDDSITSSKFDVSLKNNDIVNLNSSAFIALLIRPNTRFDEYNCIWSRDDVLKMRKHDARFILHRGNWHRRQTMNKLKVGGHFYFDIRISAPLAMQTNTLFDIRLSDSALGGDALQDYRNNKRQPASSITIITNALHIYICLYYYHSWLNLWYCHVINEYTL